MIFRLLRVIGILIAVAGAIDPAVTSMRRTPATIALISTDSDAGSSAALADRVARELSTDFTIVRGPFAGASAVVIVGDRLPAAAGTLPSTMPAFAVTTADDRPAIHVAGIRAPARAVLDSRALVESTIRTSRLQGQTIEVTLSHNGAVVDRLSRKIENDAETLTLPLTFVPTAEGPATLTISAGLPGAADRRSADVMVNVSRDQWAVLAFDRRPSWMSTFVRRALEQDPRFVVTSRVVTSRNLSSDTGRPPGALDDLPSLSLFDAVVIGAPEELNDRDVAGIEEFLRRRGGAVCLLFDRRQSGAYERLLGSPAWSSAATTAAVTIERTTASEQGLQATEMMWPASMPPGTRTIAATVPAAGDDKTSRRPVIWSLPAGSGRVIVNGALDAWRYREPAPAAFDRFWQGIVADAAAAAPPLVDVRVREPLLAPGESTPVAISLRDESLAAPRAGQTVKADVQAVVDGPAGSVVLRVWPDGGAGQLQATWRAPASPGMYSLSVTANGTRTRLPIVVRPAVIHAEPDERDLIAAWTASRGGIAVPATRSREIEPALTKILPASTQRITWHPMESAWWILPFALALGGEWWWRRVGGKA